MHMSYYMIVLFAEQPVNIYSQTNLNLETTTSLIPNGAIVNDVEAIRFSENKEDVKRQTTGPPGAITLTCEVLPGYENPYWEVTDNSRFVNPIQDQIITNANGSEIALVTVMSSSNTSILTIFISQQLSFPDDLNGTYTCRASNSDAYSSVILTNSESYPLTYSYTLS